MEASKHKRGRVLVFLADGSLLKVTEQELLTFGLRSGDELDEATLTRLKEAAGVSNIKTTAADLVGRRAMSRRDLEKKLQEKGASETEARYAGEWLEAIGALDDGAYAAALVRHCGDMGGTAPGGPEKSCGKRACLRSFGTRRWTSCPRTGSRSTAFYKASSTADPRRIRRRSG